MLNGQLLIDSLLSLEKYISSENYRGYDPYDGLMSPLFKLPLLRSGKTIRFYSQQILRRIPFNYRPLLRIRKGYNPVTIGLCIQAYTYLLKSGLKDSRLKTDDINSKILHLIEELKSLSAKGFSGYCWGYDFDWEAKYASNPAFTPTIVATGIITNGLFEYYNYSKREDVFDIIKSAADFVTKDLNKNFDGEDFCFSYSPFDGQKVYNASMKAARLLSQVYSVTRDKILFDEAKKAVSFVAKNQNEDGSWFYSKDDGRNWIDNFHTGYVLDCLDEYIKLTGDSGFSAALNKGYEYYVNNFFEPADAGGNQLLMPKYYSNKLHPVDTTSLAQSVLTLTRFGDTDKAGSVTEFALSNLFDVKKYFYYRVNKHGREKVSFMRWSNAWMFCALAYNFYMRKSTE